tara:strand:- start:4220 stop:5110 length:891 start_codon:yes stop_codon:yes gene_type:complete
MGGKARRKLQTQMMDSTSEQITAYRAEQKIQRDVLAKQKNEYRQFQFKNPYANMQNQYAGMENAYEDLTVNKQAADFQMEQGAQQRSNIMGSLRGAAGGSGIAGLAQSLANQGQLQARQVSADIGQQESRNQMMKARGASAVDIAQRKGAGAADMAQRGGEAMVQSAEMQRQSTLLGIEYGGMQGANAGVQAAYGNQMSAYGAGANMIGAQMGMTGAIIGGAAAGASDRKLKKNINKIGESPSGLNIYSFEFKNSKYGEGLFQGVMSDEVPQDVVGTRDGYDTVDYSKLDVEFKQI